MDAYTGFAQVYDLFMDNVPYDEWCAYICETLKKHGIADGPVLDLGCGTGELTRRLAACGYDMTGVDVSVDMLQKAMEKQTMDDVKLGVYPRGWSIPSPIWQWRERPGPGDCVPSWKTS